jgi:hypothetical protein
VSWRAAIAVVGLVSAIIAPACGRRRRLGLRARRDLRRSAEAARSPVPGLPRDRDGRRVRLLPDGGGRRAAPHPDRRRQGARPRASCFTSSIERVKQPGEGARSLAPRPLRLPGRPTPRELFHQFN